MERKPTIVLPRGGAPGLAIGGPAFPPTNEHIRVTMDGFTLKGGRALIVGAEQDSVSAAFIDTVFTRHKDPNETDAIKITADDDAVVSVTCSRCRIVGNRGFAGAGVTIRNEGGTGTTTFTMENSVIARNKIKGSYGGAAMRIYSAEGDRRLGITLTNVTITRNVSASEYGGIWFGGNGEAEIALDLVNTILWGNRAAVPDEGADLGESSDLNATVVVNVDHVDLGNVELARSVLNDQGGNLSVDPRFASSNDIHLGPTSPLIDAGTEAGAPPADIDGDPRPIDGDGDSQARTDIGADEFTP